jgi:hypothetical protein
MRQNCLEPSVQNLIETGMKFYQYYPCQILKNKLYLGDANHACSKYVIKNLGITHIANITDCVPCTFQDEVNYLHLECLDTVDYQIT